MFSIESDFLARREMLSGRECLTLEWVLTAMLPIPSRRKKLLQEPDFQRPPLWIHASSADKCFRAADKISPVLARPAKRLPRENARSK